MDNKFFGEQIERLRKCYSPGALNEERINLLWGRFKGVENHVFRNAIDFLIAEHTSLTLPAMSRFADAVGMFRTSASAKIDYAIPRYSCEGCQDRGWDFIGHTVTACVCALGRSLHPEKINSLQRQYNCGRELFPSPFDGQKPKPRAALFPELPYNPDERFER